MCICKYHIFFMYSHKGSSGEISTLVLKLRQNRIKRFSEVEFGRLVKLVVGLKGELWGKKTKRKTNNPKQNTLQQKSGTFYCLFFMQKNPHKLSSCLHFLLSHVTELLLTTSLGIVEKILGRFIQFMKFHEAVKCVLKFWSGEIFNPYSANVLL